MLHARQSPRDIVPVQSSPTPSVAVLAAEVVTACEGPPEVMGARIVAALRRAAAEPALLTAALRQPHAGCYARHPIHGDPAGRFTVLSLVWAPGQFSLPHAHHTWCAYAVCENALTERLYSFNATTGKAAPGPAAIREPGYACFAPAGLDQIHRLGNAGAATAISIHVYGVERARVGTHVNRLIDVAE